MTIAIMVAAILASIIVLYLIIGTILMLHWMTASLGIREVGQKLLTRQGQRDAGMIALLWLPIVLLSWLGDMWVCD